MKETTVTRITAETRITLTLNPFGDGNYEIGTGIGFFDHMLELFARHGRFDLSIICQGDKWVDGHHTVEDVGIALGTAFVQALGDKKGVTRYASLMIPMDEALVLVSLDLSGRAYLQCELNINAPMIGDFDTELVEEFLRGFTRSMGLTLHVRQMAGHNGHHIVEAVFKGLARTLSTAIAPDPRRLGRSIPCAEKTPV